ncbi:MAG: 50S ribosome-binding GTPase [Alphaproteobacteria bacterium]|nr:50S ribosome-binding GTPase [Alphaproteobacteria bacterium]
MFEEEDFSKERSHNASFRGENVTDEEAKRIKKDHKILEKTLALIDLGEKELSKHTDQESILVIGRTGVGKSTLVNYLTNPENMHVINYKNPKSSSFGKGKLVIDLKNNSIKSPAIGHAMDSETTVPNKWSGQNVVYWDCPGFDHVDDSEKTIPQDIANAFFIKKIFNITEKAKILLVLSWEELGSTRADKIKSLTDTLGNLFQRNGFDKMLDGLSLVVTKTDGKDIDDMKEKIAENLTAKCFRKESIGKQILEFFLNSDKKISLFNAPRQVGELTEGKNKKLLGPQNHSNMIRVIDETVFIDKPKVNVAVSKDSLLAVEGLAKSVNTKVNDLLSILCQNMTMQYKQHAENVLRDNDKVSPAIISDLIKSLKSLYDSITELASVSENENSVSVFTQQIEERIINNDSIRIDKDIFKEVLQNVGYIEFFKEVNKNAVVNVRIQEWIKRFRDFNLSLHNDIDNIKGQLKAQLNDDVVHLEALVEHFQTYKTNLATNSLRDKSFINYKKYLQVFEELNDVIEGQQNLSFDQIAQYLSNEVINPFGLDQGKLQKVIISNELNRAVAFKDTASAFEENVKNQLKIFVLELRDSYKDSINDFVRTTSITIKDIINLISDKIVDYCKAEQSIERLGNIRNGIEEIVTNNLNNTNLTELADNVDSHLFRFFGIQTDLSNKLNNYIGVLKNIINIENKFTNEEVTLLNGYEDKLQQINTHEISSIYSNLSSHLINEAKKFIEVKVEQFINGIIDLLRK